MNLNINILLIMVVVLLYIAFYLTVRMVMNKFTSLDEIYVRNNKRLSMVISIVNNTFVGTLDSLREIRNIKQNLIIDSNNELFKNKNVLKVEKYEIKKLHRSTITRRKGACVYLGLIGSDKAREALEHALLKEKNVSVKVYISNALADISSPESLDYMISALLDTHKWYREKAISNILEYGHEIQTHFEAHKNSRDIEILEFLIKYSSENYNKSTKEFLFDFVDRFDDIENDIKVYYEARIQANKTKYKLSYLSADLKELLTLACRILSNYYYLDFDQAAYYEHENIIIQTNAFWALSKSNTTEHFKLLLKYIGEDKHKKTIINVLTKMIELNPRFIYLMEDSFDGEEDLTARSRMAQVLSNKIEYYILKLNTKNDARAERLIIEILKNNKINELIGFLNINKNLEIENRLIQLLKANVVPESAMELEFRTYLDVRIIEKWKLESYKEYTDRKSHKKDNKLIRVVLAFTLISFMLLPIVFVVTHIPLLSTGNTRAILKEFVISFNYGLAFYSIAVNLAFLLLLILSSVNVTKQSKLWNYKNISMLFRNKMIPSISIVAPAYNEEKTIIASAKSLLNLNYPDYELIIVNDGSKDDTLHKLIQTFNLVRVDYVYTSSLQTEPIRGIYRNASLPKLVVIDKSNGGKADSLNAGINVANKTYFCGIDADSLLEPEALLKLASLTLDESKETPALGGNIFPINGCKVDKGLITDVHIPKSALGRFQTIEYLRAFMAGRLGWQQINSLLIISGAFGLFRKDRIIDIGGYLTEKGKFHKDTVGEDMELVVRISRLMREKMQPYRILYSFNANCWTEVPEDIKSLRNQRFRWHRGLIDILYFHRKMLFNRAYGKTGLIAMPYFLIFEALGPMIEVQGFFMVILAAILGILNVKIALLLFISTILFGIIVSLSALLISTKETHYFSYKDLKKLIFFAVIENFGPRQLISFWRLHGQLTILLGQGGWGTIKRRGVSDE